MCLKILKILPIVIAVLAILYYNMVYLPPLRPIECNLLKLNCPTFSFDVKTVEPGFEPIVEAYKNLFTRGIDSRSCLYISQHNKPIVDICGTVTGDLPNYRNQLQIVYSSTKVITATAMAILVDRGLISYDDKVTKYWPAFGQGFKENITVGDAVQHAAGLIYFDELLTLAEIRDSAVLKKRIEEARHNGNGTKIVGYHAATYGFIIGELVKIVDPKHRDLATFITEEIANPLGIEFYLGRSSMKSAETRSRIERFNSVSLFRMLVTFLPAILFDLEIPMKKMVLASTDPNHIAFKSFQCIEQAKNVEELEELPIGAMNGFSNARGLASVAEIYANKGTGSNGAVVLKPETVKLTLEMIGEEFDHVMQMNVQRTRGGFMNFTGFGLEGATGWAGFGGSFIVFNEKHQLAFGYAMKDAELSGILGARAGDLFKLTYDIIKSRK